MSKQITDFRGEYRFLSNFYPSLLIVDGLPYETLEHAYQAAKTDDLASKEQIRTASSAKEAKQFGRSVVLIDDWDDKRIDVMAALVKQKFTEHLDLKLRLLLTGKAELIEGNTWRDQFWGQTKDGVGENYLGKILMSVRDNIRAAEGTALQVFRNWLESKELGFMGEAFSKLEEYCQECAVNDDYEEINDLLASLSG